MNCRWWLCTRTCLCYWKGGGERDLRGSTSWSGIYFLLKFKLWAAAPITALHLGYLQLPLYKWEAFGLGLQMTWLEQEKKCWLTSLSCEVLQGLGLSPTSPSRSCICILTRFSSGLGKSFYKACGQKRLFYTNSVSGADLVRTGREKLPKTWSSFNLHS